MAELGAEIGSFVCASKSFERHFAAAIVVPADGDAGDTGTVFRIAIRKASESLTAEYSLMPWKVGMVETRCIIAASVSEDP